eukprot:CAMPEP_0206519010 /NCGR_PEP_ID=MMETSP0324_2-20121206/64901_1 /ASSEMBLY_ACC=CAM_ASM_000836 /TAXON_ID=2866 /ORGANISM="Crypthecodinium cohnii, Strain Seligo" /LENGTH=126 /DNA_ID=CAMNT_0054012439 /DNA_START=63 /DNA_END=440 /DNA_ORIENTATION=-
MSEQNGDIRRGSRLSSARVSLEAPTHVSKHSNPRMDLDFEADAAEAEAAPGDSSNNNNQNAAGGLHCPACMKPAGPSKSFCIHCGEHLEGGERNEALDFPRRTSGEALALAFRGTDHRGRKPGAIE